ncbi:SDR family oxidoreductase [Gordonia sp. NPDC003425]
MTTVVFGASGELGALLADELERRGEKVVRAQRSSGVDAYAGTGVSNACAGADTVIDCTNVTTMRGSKAVDFFSTVARNIAEAAKAADVRRVVCVSIVNAADPAVNAKFGYYQGKAAQEKAYADECNAGQLQIVYSAQWYELAGQTLSRMTVGPVGAIPHMVCRPLAAADAAELIADAALSDDASDRQIAGPQEHDLADLARVIAHRNGSPRWVLAMPFGGKAFRDGGLLPRGQFEQASTTFNEWLAAPSHTTGDR